MIGSKKILRSVLALASIGVTIFVAVKKLPAAFTQPPSTTHIEIDGIDYGSFDHIRGLQQFSKNGYPLTQNQYYAKVTLRRNFVTDPSLYLWAKNRRSKKSDLKNIQLVKRNMEGAVISRQILESCQPLSWTVEKANPSLGGFHETIDLAVQKLSVH